MRIDRNHDAKNLAVTAGHDKIKSYTIKMQE